MHNRSNWGEIEHIIDALEKHRIAFEIEDTVKYTIIRIPCDNDLGTLVLTFDADESLLIETSRIFGNKNISISESRNFDIDFKARGFYLVFYNDKNSIETRLCIRKGNIGAFRKN